MLGVLGAYDSSSSTLYVRRGADRFAAIVEKIKCGHQSKRLIPPLIGILPFERVIVSALVGC